MTKALVVFSGGQDSTTCLGWALARFEEVHAITFNYGQRHDREIEAAARVIQFFEEQTGKQIPHEILEFPEGIFAGTSPLTNMAEELETYTSHDEMEAIIGDRIEKTFVPMRNAVFLMVAANRAAVLEIKSIITGVCQGDNANYPDCRLDFIHSANVTINKALGEEGLGDINNTNIYTPLMYKSKADTVRLAIDLPHTYEALAFSHTAYDGNYPPGMDHASVLRAHGFAEAGMPDPLILRAHYEGKLPELPTTDNYNEGLAGTQIRQMSKFWRA